MSTYGLLREFNTCHEPGGKSTGGRFCGGNADAVVEVLQKKLMPIPSVSHLPRPHFILPDGTMVRHEGATHEEGAALLGLDLQDDILRAGVLRMTISTGYMGRGGGFIQGASTGGRMTNAQAEAVMLGVNPNGSFSIDVMVAAPAGQRLGKYTYVTESFDADRTTSTALRNWVNARVAEGRLQESYGLLREYNKCHDQQDGQFCSDGAAGVKIDPTKKDTWYRNGGKDWNRSVDGEKPWGWLTVTPDYQPPPRKHNPLRVPWVGLWGASHSNSSVITGESAKQMGIEGYRDFDPNDYTVAVARAMVQAIADDTVGSEEPLYHSFENVRQTVFVPGDTVRLPLTATAGKPESYGSRLEHENQRGVPTYFRFAAGTPMVAYSTVTKRDLQEFGQTEAEFFKERGYIWDEAVVAGKFRVVKVETVYIGSQHSEKPVGPHEPIPQLYGQVVHLEPVEKFDPVKKKWVPIG